MSFFMIPSDFLVGGSRFAPGVERNGTGYLFKSMRKPLEPLVGDKARVAELVDALDLGSSGLVRGSSSLPSRTIHPL
jgi:hypothetical protein